MTLSDNYQSAVNELVTKEKQKKATKEQKTARSTGEQKAKRIPEAHLVEAEQSEQSKTKIQVAVGLVLVLALGLLARLLF